MKHNHPLFCQVAGGDKEASNTTALIEANVSAQCERPYLELLGSEEREKDTELDRERDNEEGQRKTFQIC